MKAFSVAHLPSRGDKPRSLYFALLVSVVLHVTVLTAAQLWGHFNYRGGPEVCFGRCSKPNPQINVELVERRKLPFPQQAQTAYPRQQFALVSPVLSKQPLAAPKRGHIVLPDETLRDSLTRQTETTARLPCLSPQHVVPQSEAGAPVVATPEVFSRAESLVTGAPGEHGLGGTGKATGAGPFGTAPDGSGTKQIGGVPGVTADPTAVPETRLSAPQPAKATVEVPRPSDGPTRPPALLDWSDPPYPERARQEGRQGTVVLWATIDTDGKPTRVEVAVSSGSEILDHAAQACMMRARFSPALKRGRPVPASISFRVRFRLILPTP